MDPKHTFVSGDHVQAVRHERLQDAIVISEAEPRGGVEGYMVLFPDGLKLWFRATELRKA
jgi:hypothetical protein